MKTKPLPGIAIVLWFLFVQPATGQTLINVDFGGGTPNLKVGLAATGLSTNDTWNVYRQYEPRFVPGMPLVPDGHLDALKYADGTKSKVSIGVTNAPGVWGNASGDPMFDSYVFAPNGSNIVVRVSGLEAGRYHFYLYGHADADVSAEQNSSFGLLSGTNRLGPLAASGVAGWQAGQPWRERGNFVVFRDVAVAGEVVIEVGPGQGGIAVLNGLQILSRGTAPPRLTIAPPAATESNLTNLLFRRIQYEGQVSANTAAFQVKIEVESRSTNEISGVLFEGDLAMIAPKLPEGWRVVQAGKRLLLFAARPGAHEIEMQLLARPQRVEPWNEISFTGPPAAISTVSAEAADDAEVQLRTGTALSSSKSAVRGVLGADQQLVLRWQSKSAEVRRDAVLLVDSRITGNCTPTAIRYVSRFEYEILQARVSELRLSIPAEQTLTKLEGEQVRDWNVRNENGQQILTVEFIRPLESSVKLTLTTEQPLSALGTLVQAGGPSPLGIQRESGRLSLRVEDVVPRIESSTGLRQMSANEKDGEALAFRFNARPAVAQVRFTRIEPELNVAARVKAVLEESRMTVRHDLDLQVTKAGIYNLELSPQAEFTVAEVSGDGVEDWNVAGGKLRVSFGQRVLGARKLAIGLERALTNTPPQITILPLGVTGALKESAFIGAGSSAGIQLKTATVEGAREMPVNSLPARTDELLAFRAEQSGWRIGLSAEKLAVRLVADVFNLLTIGDGIVGGSATIRYGIVNQGMQQFRVRLPAHWRNVEFTGVNLRRKDQQGDVWTISLQDKAWGGYTLVISYDYPFDPKQAQLNAAGAHALDAERESGSVAITAATGLSVQPGSVAEPLRSIDPTELGEANRALITRPVLLSYRYDGNAFALALNVARHSEVPVLDAVTDRAQLTSVLTPEGQMLTQASFMVKNNERQFQRFQLPAGATLWGVLVNGTPVKAERDADWLLVSLPRAEDRDLAFAIDIQYAQEIGQLGRFLPRGVDFQAPKTDVPGTYAQWDLYVPGDKHVSGFGGNMTVARGTSYGLREGWNEFVRVYTGLWHDYAAGIVVTLFLILLVVSLGFYGRHHGMGGVAKVLAVFCIVAILGSMLLPALSKAKSKAQRIKSVNNLKNIGLAARIFATDHGRMPNDLEEMLTELGTEKILYDPATGEKYTYVGAGKSEADASAILAYSNNKGGHREVVMADGSVQQVNEARFNELIAKEAVSRAAQVAIANGPTAPTATDGAYDALAFYKKNPELMRRYFPSMSSNAIMGAVAAQVTTAGVGAVTGAPITAVPSGSSGATATGIRSLKIEIPKAGHAYHFTRVLNLSGEPPRIRASFMSARAFLTLRSSFEVTAFLAGLIMVWYQWRKAEPRTFWLTVGVGLALVGVADLFINWRALHLVLIVGLPAIALGLILWLIWLALRRVRRGSSGESGQALPSGLSPVPPTVALLLAGLFSWNCYGADPVSVSKPPVSIASATFEGQTHDRVAELTAQFHFISPGTNATVMLFDKDVAVRDFSAVSGEARLVREGEKIGVLLSSGGEVSAKMTFLVKVAEESGRRKLDFALPPAIGISLNLVLDEPDAAVEFPNAVASERSLEGGKTRVKAVLGGSERLVLTWTPRLKRAAEIAATAFVQQASLVTFSNGAATIQSVFDYQVTQGELRQIRISLPNGERVLRVKGELVRSWNFSDEKRDELVVDLLTGASPGTRLTIESESAVDQLPATYTVRLPRPLNVRRADGVIAVSATEEIGLTAERAAGVERIENAEFSRAFGAATTNLVSAWRFLRPDFDLAIRLELLQPKIEATARHSFVIGAEQVTIHSEVNHTVARAGIFALRFNVPGALRIETVLCEPMQSWTERTEGGARQLEINLKQRTLGPIAVELVLVRALTNLPPTVDLAAPHPLGVGKLTGFIAVSAEQGIGLKTSTMSGLTEIPASAAGSASQSLGVLAFKFIATEPQATAPWRLGVQTELLESWVLAEIHNSITISETLMSGRSVVRYDIQNAPRREFTLRIPASFKNVEILGEGIRRRDQTNEQWRVELQNKVRGRYQLTVLWEQSRPIGATGTTGTNEFSVAGVQAVGVERETGAISFQVKSPLQITPVQASEELTRIDARELPAWAVDSKNMPALVYRYLRPGWQLRVNVTRFSEAAVLQALVDTARLRSVVADDGQVITQMALSVRNNGRQHLELKLPAGAKVWSAFVSGQPVRPAQEGERLLVPLEAGAESASLVELTYVSSGKFPRTRGKVEMASPLLNVPLKDARWELFLPPEYDYKNFRGSMSYERADLVEVAQDFTLAEYARQEISKQEAAVAQELETLKQAKDEFENRSFSESQGKLSQIRSRFSSARGTTAARELKELEDKISQAQSSNLIQAQTDLARQNAERFGVADQQGAKASRPLAYDAKVAEQQVAQVQRAQEVAVSRVTPLHVNLPTRGLRHSFVQVLQTEVNKPLTISFSAINEQQTGWLKTILLCAVAFGLLWLLTSVATFFRGQVSNLPAGER